MMTLLRSVSDCDREFEFTIHKQKLQAQILFSAFQVWNIERNQLLFHNFFFDRGNEYAGANMETLAGCHSPSMICLELFNGILNHILKSQVIAPFSKSCTELKLYSVATGNNYGERRTRCANNYYHVQQRNEVIAHSFCCLLPTNGIWELKQGPIRSEGHKQVGEFLFYCRLMDGHWTSHKKIAFKLYQQPIPCRNEQHEGYRQHCCAVDATVFG